MAVTTFVNWPERPSSPLAMNEFEAYIIQKANYVGFIFLIALFSLINSALLLAPLGFHARELLWTYIVLSSGILFLDFLYFLIRMNRRGYLIRSHGWLAFVGSLPIPGFSFLRLLQIGLIARKLRRADLRLASSHVFAQRASTTLLVMTFIGIAAFEISTVFILQAEGAAADANIRTPWDAVWWAYVTFSTVGYGDRYPVTTFGRVVGLFAVTVGVALFSVITGFLADWFRRPRQRRLQKWNAADTADEPTPSQQIVEIKRLLEEMEASYQHNRSLIQERLQTLERLLAEGEEKSAHRKG